eukprot:scaffold118374_cov41-Tisochrysis_lutea.AAC.1
MTRTTAPPPAGVSAGASSPASACRIGQRLSKEAHIPSWIFNSVPLLTEHRASPRTSILGHIQGARWMATYMVHKNYTTMNLCYHYAYATAGVGNGQWLPERHR